MAASVAAGGATTFLGLFQLLQAVAMGLGARWGSPDAPHLGLPASVAFILAGLALATHPTPARLPRLASASALLALLWQVASLAFMSGTGIPPFQALATMALMGASALALQGLIAGQTPLLQRVAQVCTAFMGVWAATAALLPFIGASVFGGLPDSRPFMDWPTVLSALLLAMGLGLRLWTRPWRSSQQEDLAALRLAHAQLAATVDHMPLAMIMVDDQGLIQAINPAALALTGHERYQLMGHPVAEVLPAWASLEGSHLTAGLEPRTPARTPAHAQERTWLCPAMATAFEVNIQLAPFTVEDQHRCVITLKDLRTEQAANESLRRWDRIFHEAGRGLALSSPGEQATIDRCNHAYAALLGYAPQALLGRPLQQVIAPQAYPHFMALRAQALQQGHARAECALRHQGGHDIPALLDLSVVCNAQGQAECVVISIDDLRERKQAQARLQESEFHLRSVIQSLPVGVWIGNEQGEVLQVNQAVERMWGQVARVSVTQNQMACAWWEDRRYPPARADALLRRAVVAKAPIRGGVIHITEHSGLTRTVLCSATPLLDAQGQVCGALAVDEDITDLHRTEQVLQQTNGVLERILESSAVGMAVCDAHGQVARTNGAWRTLLGRFGQRLLREALAEHDTLAQRNLLEDLCISSAPPYMGEHLMRRADGRLAWTLLIASRLPGLPDASAQALVQLLDIDEQKRALDTLSKSQQRLAAAQRLAGLGEWVWHIDTDEVECSEQLLALLRLPNRAAGRLPRTALIRHIHADDWPQVAAASALTRRSHAPVEMDLRWIGPDGEERDLHAQAVARMTPEGALVSGTVQDVTERKRIERELLESRQQLRELVAYEDQAIEEERKHIAREVHDELGQLLTALRMDLTLLRKTQQDDTLISRIEAMRQTVDTTIEVVRHVASNLRPAALDMGLMAAIEWLAEDFSHRWEVSCELRAPSIDAVGDEINVPEPVALALFRVVQESLTNVARHAKATRVYIDIIRTRTGIELSVTDNGQGFDLAQVPSQRLGLLGMRERMRAIGAELNLTSSHAGTRVQIVYAAN